MTDRVRRAIEILDKLVGFDTTSHLSNYAIIDFIEAYLKEYGVQSVRIEDDLEDKANLFATIGPNGDGGVVLSAHTDVVPITGQDWTSLPFKLTEKQGKLYGRGSCDMKGFLAATLAMVPDYLAAPLTRPIHLAYTYDEEVGCKGVWFLAKKLGQELPKPELVIVGEPTLMQPVDAHKSIHSFHTTITGHEAHSSILEQGVSAITYGARFVEFLVGINQRLKEGGTHSDRFTPGWSTVHVGTIEGGTALNIVPKTCRIHWEIRGLPDDNIDAIVSEINEFANGTLVAEMQEKKPDTGIVTEQDHSIFALRPEPGSAAERLVTRLTKRNDVDAVSYGTEAGVFQHYGFPTIVCGPGSIEQAHKPDEWLAIGELERCLVFLDDLGKELEA